MSDASGSNIPCLVDKKWLPHMFLIPAGIILTILAFLRKRTSFKRDVWGGRPGIVIPIDFLGMDHDRLAVVFVFGGAAGMIGGVILGDSILRGKNAWEAAFLLIVTAIEIAFLYYPYFACLASYHRIIGAMMGLPYAVAFFVVNMVSNLEECDNHALPLGRYQVLLGIPIFLCHLLIVGKFGLVLYKEIKENYGTCAFRLFFSEEEEQSAVRAKLTRPWLLNHVKNLVNSRAPRAYSGIWRWLRKIYNPEKNFKFSAITLSVFMICFIILYDCSITFIIMGVEYIRQWSAGHSKKWYLKLLRGILDCVLAAVILAGFFCIVSLIRFMENHKNNMLRMFRGDKSFIPKTINTSQFMLGKGLRFHCFQFGYFLWGYILLYLVFFCICFLVFAFFSYSWFRDCIKILIEGAGVMAGVALLTRLSLPLTSYTIFRDYSYSKNVISINNRNVYLLFSYFWFFVGLPMGVFSAISRILKAMVVGVFMLPRVDHSILPDGFQRLDSGFMAYIGYLHVQAAYRNPVLRVFCQILCDETRSTGGRKWRYSAKARSRWFLALTLARNPQLAYKRKGVIQADTPMQATALRSSMVEVEIVQFGSEPRLIEKM